MYISPLETSDYLFIVGTFKYSWTTERNIKQIRWHPELKKHGLRERYLSYSLSGAFLAIAIHTSNDEITWLSVWYRDYGMYLHSELQDPINE